MKRERPIKAAQGKDSGCGREKFWHANKTVCTISVIHSQIKEPEKVIRFLCCRRNWELSEDTVRKKVEKISSIERMRTNVEKKVGDEHTKGRSCGGQRWMKTTSDIIRMEFACFQSPGIYRRRQPGNHRS